MVTTPDERYPYERQRLIARSLRDEPNYWYGKFEILRQLVQSGLELEKFSPVRFNTELLEDVTAADIITYWKNVGGKLIIEGEAGIGKTTLLLEMVDILAREAALDETLPIPAIVHLGTWHQERKNLQDFIHPLLPANDSSVNWWLRRGKLMLMLEGLEDVPLKYRAEAQKKIRQLITKFPQTQVLVTAKPDEIEPFLPEFEHRIELLPLGDEQVLDYLNELGPHISGLREAIQVDADLAALAKMPLLLRMMILVFGYQTADEIVEYGVKTRGDLMGAYVEWCMDNAEVDNSPYPRDKIRHWLSWLGYQYHREGQHLVDLNVDMTHKWVSDPTLFRKLFPLRERLLFPAMYSGLFLVMATLSSKPLLGLIVGYLIGIPLLMMAWASDEYQLSDLYAGARVVYKRPSVMRVFIKYLVATIALSTVGMLAFGLIDGEHDIKNAFELSLASAAIYIFVGGSALASEGSYSSSIGSAGLEQILVEEGSIPQDFEVFRKYAAEELYLLQNWGRMTGFLHGTFRDYFAGMYESSMSK